MAGIKNVKNVFYIYGTDITNHYLLTYYCNDIVMFWVSMRSAKLNIQTTTEGCYSTHIRPSKTHSDTAIFSAVIHTIVIKLKNERIMIKSNIP